MNVCVLMPFFDAYKGGNHLPLLAACSEVQFTIITNRCKPAQPEFPPNIRIEKLNARVGPYYYGIADALFARAVLRRYPSHHAYWKQFDVLHLNQTLGMAFQQLRSTGVPVLYAIHHPVSADLDVALQESRTVLESLQWRLKYALPVAAQRKLCRTLLHIMTVSHTVQWRLQNDYNADPERISVVHNGVDGTVFTPSDTTCHDVVAVGSFLHPRKGFRYLLDVYRQLAVQGRTIADVGKRSDEQRAALEKIDGVTVYGMVDANTVVSLVRESQCLVSTSLYEGFGLSLIEALACGRPAFAFDVGAVREVLEPIDSSLVVPPRNTDVMVQRIETFLSSSEAQKRSKQAFYREEVLRRYSMDKAAQHLCALYNSLIA